MSLKAPIKSKFRRWTSDSSSNKDGKRINKNLPSGWFAISHHWFTEAERKKLRGKWFQISNQHEGHCFRVLSMDPTLKTSRSEDVAQINIDWDGWLNLNHTEKVASELELQIKPVRMWHAFHLGLSHPDPAVQIASKIANISIAVAMISMVIAATQFLVSWAI